MKQLTSAAISLRAFSTFLMILFLQTVIFAQDGGSGSGTSGGSGGGSESSSSTTKSVSVTTETSTWYTEPWVWVVGAALLILLLVALLRGSGRDRVVAGRTDKVTVTKTTSSDTDI
jgi:hypothetical protein